jgi:biotin transport system substrate-specific component
MANLVTLCVFFKIFLRELDMKVTAKQKFLSKHYLNSKSAKFVLCLLLSWLFAICSQIIIPLPFNLVPISLQTFGFFFCALALGWFAVNAYLLCLFQAALGAPFFSGFEGGIVKLVGPTAGYIWGFVFAIIFLALVKNFKKNSFIFAFAKLFGASAILYTFGLSWLSFFVSVEKLFWVGLYPFIFGDVLKMFVCATLIKLKR